jgi:DNA-binding response OmpR family regulator
MSENIDRLITRDELLVEVWGDSAEVVTRAADTTMCRLRSKIEIDAAAPDHLLTIYGEGYRFMPL